jgi:hypothetical protein
MSVLEILTEKEKKLFDSPPQFSSNNDRKIYFNLDEKINKILSELRGSTNKLGFYYSLVILNAQVNFI